MTDLTAFFDALYAGTDRYWWRGDWRYSTDPDDHPRSLLTQLTLRHVTTRSPGSALDVGCGEGADAIRLARLGWQVDAIDASPIGVQKTRAFAEEAGVSLEVHCAKVDEFEPARSYDLVICNGVLHYIEDKEHVLGLMEKWTAPGGAHVISLWSDFTPVPEPHQVVPTYPDREDGVVVEHYRRWAKLLMYFDREKPETGHSDFPPHVHSYIKLIAFKRSLDAGSRMENRWTT